MALSQNDLDLIKSGFVQYIGAIQSIIDENGLEKNQTIVDILMDEVIKISQVEPNSFYCSPYILAPMFSRMEGVLIQQIQVMSQQEQTEEIKHRIVRYKAMIQELNYMMEKSLVEVQEEVPNGKKESNSGNINAKEGVSGETSASA